MAKFINTKNFDIIEYNGIPKGEDWVKIPEGTEIIANTKVDGICFYKLGEKYLDNFYKNIGWVQTCYQNTNYKEIMKENSVEIVSKDLKVKSSNDLVNHPKHYTEDPSGVECIELTSCLSAPISNSLKYLWRCGLKDEDIQELGKAMFYLDYAIEHNIDVGCNGMNETFEFEEKVKRVLSHWSGWKYIFLNALYWCDKEQMKRALSELLNEAKSKSC